MKSLQCFGTHQWFLYSLVFVVLSFEINAFPEETYSETLEGGGCDGGSSPVRK